MHSLTIMRIFHFPREYFYKVDFIEVYSAFYRAYSSTHVCLDIHIKLRKALAWPRYRRNLHGNVHQSFVHYPSFVNCILCSLTAYAFFLIMLAQKYLKFTKMLLNLGKYSNAQHHKRKNWIGIYFSNNKWEN